MCDNLLKLDYQLFKRSVPLAGVLINTQLVLDPKEGERMFFRNVLNYLLSPWRYIP